MVAELLLVLLVIGFALRELYLLRRLRLEREEAERTDSDKTDQP